jgi:Heterokaryon incompatibility protein Het-C
MARVAGGKKFNKMMVARVYFGNWLRDYCMSILSNNTFNETLRAQFSSPYTTASQFTFSRVALLE